MSRVCEISGKNVMSGNNVSHAKNKTKRKFLPNLQNVKFFSKILYKFISMKVSVHALKSVEKNGGLDDYLKKTSNRVLAPEALAIKKSILKTTKSTAQDS
jgi:large subunit ribosomal protein L28